MRLISFSLLCIIIPSIIFPQQLTPLEKSDYSKPTSYNELVDYIYNVTLDSKYLSIDTLAKSVEGRAIYFIKNVFI